MKQKPKLLEKASDLEIEENCVVPGLWKHIFTGDPYTLIGIANETATRCGWVPTAVYRDSSGWLLTRPLSEWTERFELVTPSL